MKPSTSLFSLLHSLSQAEKRYLSVYSERHVKGEQNKYKLLLDAIWKQSEYDEAAIKKLWAENGNKASQFAASKNYLFGLALQAMRDFHRSENPHAEVQAMIEDANFLIARGLSDDGLKMADRAMKKAVQFELNDLILQINRILRTQSSWRQSDKIEQEHAELAENSKAALTEIQLNLDAEILYYKVLRIARQQFRARSQKLKTEVDALIESETLAMAGNSNQFTPRLFHHRSKALVAQLNGDHEQAYYYQMLLFQRFQKHPVMQRKFSGAYLTTVANLLAASHTAGQYESMPSILSFLKSIPANSPKEKIEIKQNLLYYKLLHALNTDQWEAIPHVASDLVKLLEKKSDGIPHSRITAIRYNVGLAYFFLEDYSAALAALNEIQNGNNGKNRKDIQRAARLMQAVVHYQLGHLDLLEYLLRSLQRQLKSSQTLYEFEETLIQDLKQLIKQPNLREEILEGLLDKLQKLSTDPEKGQAPGLLELRYWAEASILGCSLITVVKQGRQ